MFDELGELVWKKVTEDEVTARMMMDTFKERGVKLSIDTDSLSHHDLVLVLNQIKKHLIMREAH